ncbi:MAG: hypothetical protein AB4372_11865 [Xenococcus sp. (in: cyanobacteria)]
MTLAVTLPFLKASCSLARASVISVGGDNACQLDWKQVHDADSTAWNFTGDLGDRNDLSRVYYHSPSKLYIRISVAQRWNWNGKKAAPSLNQPELSDDNRFVPKITDYSHYGTGGYGLGEYLFAIGLNTTNHDLSVNDAKNKIEIEFFQDSSLTQKAEVKNLNFVATDLDSGNTNTEQIVIEVEDSTGNQPILNFDRPLKSSIDNNLIDLSSNTVTGVAQEIIDSTGNIAPVIQGNTHKLSLTYQLKNSPTTSSNDAFNKYTYLSNLSWCGQASNFPDDEPIDLGDPVGFENLPPAD